MSYNKKHLKELKRKMEEKNPGSLNNIRKKTSKKKEIIKNEKYEKNTKHIITKWNFYENELVHIKNIQHKNSIGLIINTQDFHGKSIKKNFFLVLVENKLLELDGKNLYKII